MHRPFAPQHPRHSLCIFAGRRSRGMNFIGSQNYRSAAEPQIDDLRDIRDRAAIAAAVALSFADDVDKHARFPSEAIESLKAERLLGIAVPRELGGEGASITEIADVCYALGRACASTGMIYAMHQTKIACIVDHGHGARWHDALLRRLNKEQLLFASSTTEGQGGGNVRSSAAAIINESEGISLTRDATVISYGAEADGIVTTAARAA